MSLVLSLTHLALHPGLWIPCPILSPSLGFWTLQVPLSALSGPASSGLTHIVPLSMLLDPAGPTLSQLLLSSGLFFPKSVHLQLWPCS